VPGKPKKKKDAPTPEKLVEKKRRKAAQVKLKRNRETAGLSERQANLALEIAANPLKSSKQQCIDAGYSENCNPALIRKTIDGKLSQTLADAGIFEADLGRVIAEGLSAMQTTIVKKVTRENGKITEETIDTIETPDLAVRHRYLQTALTLGRYFPAKRIEGDFRFEHGHRVLEILEQVPLEAIEERTKELLPKVTEYEEIEESA
jgi:hypothetical protein